LQKQTQELIIIRFYGATEASIQNIPESLDKNAQNYDKKGKANQVHHPLIK
jgi:hypothetical protein